MIFGKRFHFYYRYLLNRAEKNKPHCVRKIFGKCFGFTGISYELPMWILGKIFYHK